MNFKPETNYKLVSWDKLYRMCIKLTDQIKQSDFRPTILVGIARGGWVIARVLSDLLNNSNVASMLVKFYTDIYETEKKPRITQPVSTSVKDENILLIDDVSDSGKSLRAAIEHILAKGCASCKTATIHFKPWSITKPDFFVEETEAWIIYPHELYETLSLITKTKVKEGQKKGEIYQFFASLGVDQDILGKFLDEILA
ncbi:MAG: phosphoribosyltransferase [Promethearchaeota archaeon]